MKFSRQAFKLKKVTDETLSNDKTKNPFSKKDVYYRINSKKYKSNKGGNAALTYEKFKYWNLNLKWIRYIALHGEKLMDSSKFDDALPYLEKYLGQQSVLRKALSKSKGFTGAPYIVPIMKICLMILQRKTENSESRKLDNMEEEQNALEKLGIFLMYEAKNTNNEKKAKEALSKAQSEFEKSLSLCDQLLVGKQNVRKLMAKQALLLLNCGVIKQWSGQLDQALENIIQATEICMEHQLDEMLLNCYLVQALYYTNTCINVMSDTDFALSQLCKALKLAAMLPNMDEKECLLMYHQADAYCKQSKYEKARRVLEKAKRINCSEDELNKAIENKLEYISDMRKHKEVLAKVKFDHAAVIEVCMKLGATARKLHCYRAAIIHYERALESGKIIQKRTKQDEKLLAPIYSSLFTCHKALKDYAKAVQYKREECGTLYGDRLKTFDALYTIVKIQCKMKKQYYTFIKNALEAIKIAEEIKDDRRHIKILKLILIYQKHCGRTEDIVKTKNKLRTLGFNNFDDLEDSSDDEENPAKDMIIIRLGQLSDLSNSDEEETPSLLRRPTSTSTSEYTIQRNQYGESKLQEECREGHKDKVLQLLSEGHPIDVTDHAGWTPLHEACEKGHKEIAQILINKGADVNHAVNSDCLTPLHKAAGRGHLQVMESFLNSNANTPVKDGDSHQQGNKEVNRNILGTDVSNSTRLVTMSALNSIEIDNPVTDRTLPNGRTQSTDITDKRAKPRETEIKNKNDVDQSKTKGNKRKSTEESEKSPNAMENTPKKARPEEKNPKKVCPAKKTPKKITTPKKSTISANNSQIKTPKYMRVKVQVEGESFWIPVDMDTINDFNMSWLVTEAQFRYFKATNNRVELTLMAEGARISEDDPLCLVHNFTEFTSFINKTHTSNVEDDNDITTVDAPMDVVAVTEPIPSTSTMEPNRTIPEKKYTKDQITKIIQNAINNTNVDENFHAFCKSIEFLLDIYFK